MNKKILLLLVFVLGLSANCFAATITRYVNPASAGGNGTTADLSGANAAYASLNVFESSEQQNLTDSGGDIMVVNCAGSTDDTTAVQFVGWTTNAGSYIQIDGDNTTGIYSSDYYLLSVTDSNGLTISENFVRLKNIQVSSGRSTAANTYGIRVHTIDAGGSDVRIEACFVYLPTGGGSVNTGIQITDADLTAMVANCNIFGTTGGYGVGVSVEAGIGNIYNNTVAGTNSTGWIRGIRRTGGTCNVTNNTVYNTSSTDYNGTLVSGGTNLSEDTTSPDGASYQGIIPTFVNAAGFNWHLDSTDTGAIDKGTDLSATFTDDIDGVTRSGTWDIGADEYVAIGAERRIILIN